MWTVIWRRACLACIFCIIWKKFVANRHIGAGTFTWPIIIHLEAIEDRCNSMFAIEDRGKLAWSVHRLHARQQKHFAFPITHNIITKVISHSGGSGGWLLLKLPAMETFERHSSRFHRPFWYRYWTHNEIVASIATSICILAKLMTYISLAAIHLLHMSKDK